MHLITPFKCLALGVASLTQVHAAGDFPGKEVSAASWASALTKAASLVSQMTNEEKNNITYGVGATGISGTSGINGCSGNSGSVPRLDFPGFCLSDGPAGVKSDLVNGYPAGVSMGASWNRELVHQRGVFMGAEFARKGVNVALGPVIEPIGRVASGGRNWEGFSADPYLAGVMNAETITGMQRSTIACVKHFAGYEQETNRMPSGQTESYSSNIDDKTMHELYLWPFQDAVRAGVGSVMCSYNRINGTYACENDYALNKLLKEELGFPGFVVTDFPAQHSGTQSAINGLDMALPDSSYWQNGSLATAVTNGSLAEARLDNMALRIVGAWYLLGQDQNNFPQNAVGMALDYTAPHNLVEGRDPASKVEIVQEAVEGHVLVKNTNHALPLKKPKFLSLYGYDATVMPVNTPGSNFISSLFWLYALQPLDATLGQVAQFLTGGNTTGAPDTGTKGTLTVGGGSGGNIASWISDPYSAIQQQAYEDDTFLAWDFQSVNPPVNPESSACLVFTNEFRSEAYDSPDLNNATADMLVTNVASKCSNTIVVIHNAWIRLVDAFVDHPNVTAILYAHLPGQNSGRALVEILYGAQSPSGRLPYTVAKNASDYGSLLAPLRIAANNTDPQVTFSEGTLIDYKYFLNNSITPRYPFGYGLSYSTFNYSRLQARWVTNTSIPTYPPNPQAKIPGGTASLFDTIALVTFDLKNSGNMTAGAIPQLYIKFPDETKVHELRGFSKEFLNPGVQVSIQYALSRRDLSRWDVVAQQWALQDGTFDVLLGTDAVNIVLRSTLTR